MKEQNSICSEIKTFVIWKFYFFGIHSWFTQRR